MTARTFVLVGWGYRSRAWMTAAEGIGLRCAGVVVRTPREAPARTFRSLAEAVRETGAAFAVASVSASSAAQVIKDAVALDLPILSETPPAFDLAELIDLWNSVSGSGLVQVAEQYPRYPSHAARLALTRSGVIGTPTQVQVSSTQLHHAAALMRAYLGVAPAPVTVRATTTTAPALMPLDRGGWTGATKPVSVTTTHAVLDFGQGRSGIYDFSDWQTRNLLRFRRLIVRGTHGELDGENVLSWGGPETIVTSRIERRQTGWDLDMSGYDTETLTHGRDVLWRNHFSGRRWSDDEHATASLLGAMDAWVAGQGPEPYSLAEGCQDAAIGCAIDQAASSGSPVALADLPW